MRRILGRARIDTRSLLDEELQRVEVIEHQDTGRVPQSTLQLRSHLSVAAVFGVASAIISVDIATR